MQITDVRFVQREGRLTVDSGFFESRVVRPLDVYREFRGKSTFAIGDLSLEDASNGEVPISTIFLEIEADNRLTGFIGPISKPVAYLASGLAEFLIGRDPLETDVIWNILYSREVDGRKGERMMAISAIDCALWDLKGKYYDEPVYRLLGGPTREELPAYASLFMYDTAPDAVRETAQEMKEKGFAAQKWFFQHGPGSGHEGRRANLAIAKAAREAAGDDHDLMFDAWMGWGRTYAMDMLDRLEPYDPAWLEEPVKPDMAGAYSDLRSAASFPIAGGEHEYTRWGFHDLLTRNAIDVAQPDALWAGGISEVDKICTVCSLHGIPVVVHGVSLPACVQLTAAQPPTVSPQVEYLPRLNAINQFFFNDPINAENGSIRVPTDPGLGVQIDESKIESETVLSLD